MLLTGYYEHAIDEKNRLAMPAKLRGQINADRDGAGFFAVLGDPSSTLWLYPSKHFERLVAQGDSALIPEAGQLGFDQGYFPMSEYVEPDSAGRLLLPERLLVMSGLGRQVVICGVRDHIELWRREGYEERLKEFWKSLAEHRAKAREQYRDSRRLSGPGGPG